MSMESKLVLLVFVIWLATIMCTEQQTNIVIPDPHTSCPTGGQQCQTLEFYIENAENYFISNTAMVFLPGTYRVSRGSLIKISHVDNFSLVGSATKIAEQSTTIYCSGIAVFVFLNISNLCLANVTFSNCGADIAALSTTAWAALYLQEVLNFQMEGVVVQNSTGHGIWGYNILGNVSIYNSVLKHNGANEGSNMRLDYRLNGTCDNHIPLTLKLNIHSSKVLFGHSLNDGAGLSLNFHGSCYQARVNVSDTQFNGNKALSTGSGGNIRIVIRTDTAIDIKICIQNSSFLNGEASNGGGMAFIIYSPDKVLSHSELCFTPSKIYLLVLNCSFLSNHAQKDGGGIFMVSLQHHTCCEVKAHISDTTLDGNTAEVLGGGLKVANISITINGGSIKNGTANYGGGIFVSSINPSMKYQHQIYNLRQFNVTGLQLHENKALREGGGNMFIGIEVSDNLGDVQIYIHNSTFQTGMAGYGGGMALFVVSSNFYNQLLCPVANKVNLLVLHCSFQSNHALEKGGGIYLSIGHHHPCCEVRASIKDVTMDKNTAGELGGGFMLDDISNPRAKVSVAVHGGSITGGAAGWGGGILYNRGPYTLETSTSNLLLTTIALQKFNITGLLLHDNKAFSGSGGNMYILLQTGNDYPSDVLIFIHNSTFNHSKAAFSGGSMHIALLDSGEGNGSCSMRTITLHVTNSYFFTNAALKAGGALLMQFGQANHHVKTTVSNCSFKDNIALVSGGAICMQDRSHNTHVSINNCSISGGKAGYGGGIAFYFSAITQTSSLWISNSVVVNNSVTVSGGGVIAALPSEDIPACYPTGNVTLHLRDTVIANNTCTAGTNGEPGSGGGLFIQVSYNKTCSFARISIVGCTFSSNNVSGLGSGGNIAIMDAINGFTTIISVEDSIIHNGKASDGGGIWYNSFQLPLECNCTSDIKSQRPVYISNTQFIGNVGLRKGADIMLTMDMQGADKKTLSQISTKVIQFESSKFVGGSCIGHHPYPATCPVISFESISKFYPEEGCINEFIFQNSTFTNASGAMALALICKAMFSDIQFTGNVFSALMAINSNIVFKGYSRFEGNYGINGGAMMLLGDNRILLEPNTSITFRGNQALHAGGAIFVNDFLNHVLGGTPCLFQPILPSFDFIYGNPNISIYMENNRANFAGTSLYGGRVDQCNAYINYKIFNFSLSITASQLFDSIFHFLSPNNSDYSVISSDPTGVCMCKDDKPHCETRYLYRSAIPGALLVIPAIAVGQRNGTVRDGIVIAVQQNPGSPYTDTQGTLCTDKTLSSDTLCQDIYFRLHSPNGTTFVYLTPGNQEGGKNSRINYLQVLVDVLPCPLGFQLQQNLHEHYACGCDATLQKHGINCSIDDQTIQRPQESWIGTNCTNFTQPCGVIVHAHCPFHYCMKEILDLHLNNSDAQCNFNRSGILCGGCRPGYSLALGTSHCLQCSNMFLLLFLVFLLAGLTLVLLLMLCNMTVSDGTVNGIIFYANIVGINSAIFFPAGQGNRFVSFLNVFIAWFNLDLGIETCLYDGMSMYQNTWFQFAFPLYIWTIVLFLVTSTHYFVFAAKVLVRRNAVKVLATLFLLSFTKLLQTTIISFSFVTLEYPDGKNKAAWLYDSNLEFLSGKHIPLFIAALLVFVFLMLPYTVLLTFGQCIQRKSSHPLLSWYTRLRLQPLLDAYAGPYKDRYRFWSGLLVTVRIMISFVFALNALGNPNINLVAIITASVLLAVCTIGLSFYKRWSITMLETLSHINLCFLSVATLFVRSSGGSQVVVTSIFVGLCFCLFSAIASYHTLQELSKTKLGLRVKTSCTQIFLTLPCLRRQTGGEEELPQQNEVEGQPLPRRAPVQHWEIALENPVGGEATLMPVLPSGTYPQSTQGHSSQTDCGSAHAEHFSEEAYWHQSQPCHNPSESSSPNPLNQVEIDECLQSHLVPDIDSTHQHYSNTSEIGINSSSTLYKACSSSFITSTSNDNPEYKIYVELETVRQNNSVNTFTDFAEVPSDSEYRDQTLPVNSCSHSQFESENKNPVEVIHHDEDSNSDTSADEYQSLLHN